MGAGAILVATILLLAGIGLGLGSIVGAALPLALAGAAVGFVAGVALVIVAFRER